MRKFGRCATTIILGILASAADQAVAQNITPEQRSEYWRQFRASPQERRTLLEAQENRVGLPEDIPGRLKQFLESSWSYQGSPRRKHRNSVSIDMERSRAAGNRPRSYQSRTGRSQQPSALLRRTARAATDQPSPGDRPSRDLPSRQHHQSQVPELQERARYHPEQFDRPGETLPAVPPGHARPGEGRQESRDRRGRLSNPGESLSQEEKPPRHRT